MERRPELDGLRGIAVLLVVLSHSSNAGDFLAPGLDVRGMGRTGVFLFFVLSSYLLTDQLLARTTEELRRSVTWARYAARRLVRVYPGYFLALSVSLALGGMSLEHAGLHLALVRAEGHFWTIPVEMLFYLLLPLIVWLLVLLPSSAWRIGSLIVAIVVTRFCFPPDYPARAPDFRPSVLPFLPVFLLGSLVAALARCAGFARDVQRWRPLVLLGTLGFLGLTPALVSLVTSEHVPHHRFHLWFVVQGLCAAMVLLGALAGAGRWLAARPLAAIGRASYSIYLLHVVPLAWFQSQDVHGVVAAWGTLGAACALGALSYALVERPFLGQRAARHGPSAEASVRS